nr:carbonic anhydrase 1 [Odocoileus virginianus texanus]
MASPAWGYDGENGPEHWEKLYPIANGNNQSPIDIKTSETKHDESLKPVSVSYNPATAKEIVNVGHSFHVNFEDSDNRSVLNGGPLCESYRLRQFHFHWGTTDDYGSEHLVDGAKFSAENKQAPFTNFDPSVLLPSSPEYWTYFGSLTHPPLHDSVTWIIFKDHISVSSEQLAQFRSLLASAEGDREVPIKCNNRPPQPLKGRTVRASC